MATEIELKAHVEDREALKSAAASFARFSGSFEKEDVYWYGPGMIPKSGLRIRQETDTDPQGAVARSLAVTYKIKETRNGIEVNDEREFTVSDIGNFEELLRRLGLAPGTRKRKRGWSWDYEGIAIELAEISGLGWFAELEILADNDRPDTVAHARSRLLTLLRRLGIGEDKIETRYYTEMLRSLQEKTP
ncbi:MAG: class IV adenylate cyclase [Spirochaetaceae bacterium]|jgi:adenylate cyclase class 2|nr:class IV adenylate cyclase [Spirochaetaceae bacterium]